MNLTSRVRRVAIACGGTGGHLFPGLAVARELMTRGIGVTLFVSPKDVDQRALQGRPEGIRVETLPVVGLSGGNLPAFLMAAWRGYRKAQQVFLGEMPDAVLGMGGFTSAGPILAGSRRGAFCCLHESNAIPGRANRWLARVVDHAFVGFAAAGRRMPARRFSITGTPVRPEFRTATRRESREALGLPAEAPVVLVMGGSQGARGVNQIAIGAIPALAERFPTLQFCHLTGLADQETVRRAYASAGVPARVHPFSQRMDLLMSAATVAVSRSGASSLAEIAAVRLPSVLIPFPEATDDHQRLNARAFVEVGAARMLDQATAGPGDLFDELSGLLSEGESRTSMRTALASLDHPAAAARIADAIERREVADGVCGVADAGRSGAPDQTERRRARVEVNVA